MKNNIKAMNWNEKHYPTILDLFNRPLCDIDLLGKDYVNNFQSIKTDVIDKGDCYQLKTELPGVKKEDINVDFEGNVITVSCPRYKRDYSEEEKMAKVCVYKKAFKLPETANMDSTMAKYENGILSLFIEKKPEFAEQKKNIVVE